MTHNERVLALLQDGKPHTHHELYALHVIAHSRVADLRARGHLIEQWREGDNYLYRLLTEPEDKPRPAGILGLLDGSRVDCAAEKRHGVPGSVSKSSPEEAPGPGTPSPAPGQMSLIEAAA